MREQRTAAAARVHEVRASGFSASDRRSAQAAAASLAHTWFQHADFSNAEMESGSVDSIMCLSVTKWVHLHRGDDGMRALFHKFYDVLAPGGGTIQMVSNGCTSESTGGRLLA